jgi:farnesyl diphosphate synthase
MLQGRREAMDETRFEAALAQRAGAVEAMLETLLADTPLSGEVARPRPLMQAIRHGVLGGGKRLRPFLVLESAALYDGDGEAALRVAAALECVHCYSLIHDDLPAMDDDDMRRGRPTVHRAFGEANAILAGDSLLTFAFDVVADEATALPGETRARLAAKLARAAGMGGMAGGQALDLAAAADRPDEAGIVRLQAMKTGALIRLAFQLADDLLDATSDSAALGKAAGKDEGAGKATLVSLHGVDWARRQLGGLVAQACELLEPFGARADTLRAAARFVATRTS